MSSMRKLNEIWRGLSRFLADPAAPLTKGWAAIKAAIPPDALAKNEDLRNAMVLYGHIAEAMVDFFKLRAGEPDESDDKQEKLTS
jgi:hypothetical protein